MTDKNPRKQPTFTTKSAKKRTSPHAFSYAQTRVALRLLRCGFGNLETAPVPRKKEPWLMPGLFVSHRRDWLLSSVSLDRFFYLGLDGVEVEGRRCLHRRKFDRCLRQFNDL